MGRQEHQAETSKLKVVLESFSFIDSNRGDAGGAPAPSRPAARSTAPPSAEPLEGDGPPESDDVPF